MQTSLLPNSLNHWFQSDTHLNRLYPRAIRLLASRHWTPLHISEIVVQFLAPRKNIKILDIGSGVGKFCLAGGYFKPEASFFGVEQRVSLISHAEFARDLLCLKNVHFLTGNLTQLDFSRYDHFYFFNSFYENLAGTEKIDDNIVCTPELYNFYNKRLYRKFAELKPGTRLATYHSLEDHIPPDYELVESHAGNLLKFWIKI